jgi:hypothetical protein
MSCSPDGSLLLVAGDSGIACRIFNDTWQLQLHLQPKLKGVGGAAQAACWQQLQQQDDCGSYTGRSNAAAAVAGDWLVLFGGWNVSGGLLQGHTYS